MFSLRTLLVFLAPLPAFAVPVNVPNYSFESPDIVYASDPPITNWTTYVANPSSHQIGLFDNTGVNSPQADHIDNADGGQLAFVYGGPGIGLYQQLSDLYEVGTSYLLTLALGGGGGGMKLGTILELRFFYRNAANARVSIATKQVTFDAAMNARDPQPINHLYDYSVSLDAVAAGSAWAGQAIGIEIGGVEPFEVDVNTKSGGYWDIDNVRLVATPIPEPGVEALLFLGAAAWGGRRRRGRI